MWLAQGAVEKALLFHSLFEGTINFFIRLISRRLRSVS
jgi:hypothetical protein